MDFLSKSEKHLDARSPWINGLVPTSIVAILIGLNEYCPHSGTLPLKELASAIINMSAISIGFLASARAILVGFPDDNPVVKAIRSTEGEERIILKKFNEAIGVALFSALISICIIAFSETLHSINKCGHYVLLGIWIYLSSVTLIAFLRVVIVFNIIERNVVNNRPPPAEENDSQKVVRLLEEILKEISKKSS